MKMFIVIQDRAYKAILGEFDTYEKAKEYAETAGLDCTVVQKRFATEIRYNRYNVSEEFKR